MKWGVRKSVKRDARERANVSRSSGKGSGKLRKDFNSKLDAKDKEIPGYKNAVIQRQRKTETRKIKAVLIGVPVAMHIASHPESVERGAKAAGKAFRVSIGLGKVLVKSAKTVRQGRKFAEEMGLSGPKYVDSAGKILKNVNPNFG
jgi:Pyruvate/2-oxoacid:ferredoxin oxidoreductase gamma subunit